MRFVLQFSSRTLIGLGALIAAVIAIVAPFLRFWINRSSEIQSGPRNARLMISGFGHNTYHPGSGQVHGHDTDYGVPLIAAAIVLTVAAVVFFTRKRNSVIPMLLAAIGGSMLAAVALEGVMDRGSRSSFDTKDSQWSVGYGWWLMMFAGGLGLIAAIAAAASVAKSTQVPSSAEVQHSAFIA